MSKRGTRVKMLLVAGAALTLLSPPAAGGILDPAPAYPVRGPGGPALPPVYDWTGFYAGLSGGASWGSAKWESDPDLTQGTVTGSSGLIGGTIGYNMQNLGPFVVGEEADISWRQFDFTIPAATCMPNCQLHSTWMGTARLRLGYAIDRFLPYATFGMSVGDFTASAPSAGFGSTGNVTFNWTAGAGIEYAVSGPWTAKLEYLYVNHTRFACGTECNGPVNLSVNENIFRVGVNYRLGGW
jgi:outer membrane immunogenic protein